MVQEQFSRTQLLIGQQGVQALAGARVAVFGVGGVGSFVVEALARSGVGHLLLVDSDQVAVSNLNRQLHATWDSVGKEKTHLMRDRVASINPQATVETRELFCLPENIPPLLEQPLDYIVDAVDTVSAKLSLAHNAHRLGIPIISCMGAGNKMYPQMFEVADIYDTSVCPLCKVMRRELKKLEIPGLKVVYSKEQPITPQYAPQVEQQQRRIPGSISFVPSVAGLILAGEVVRDLIGWSAPPSHS